ncbi:MAG TPA: hypothetical protein VE504_04340 [Nitrososphaeraceae archaeon]|nr:hypothetical protein [Nitrososphaeraceae archaeon]
MPINDFALACAIDNSPAYFTYEETTMVIITSQETARRGSSDFEEMEPYMDSLIAHESIHVVIARIEDSEISDSLDDIEVIVERNGHKFQVTINNILFATDSSGIVTP